MENVYRKFVKYLQKFYKKKGWGYTKNGEAQQK
jgi:hypothetical protein